jgi:phosphoribosylformylglycinamidine cyclo-ligase
MSATNEALTYAASGVNYDLMDPFKRVAQEAARATAPNLEHFGMSEVAASRGESAYLIETPEMYLAHVEEGLGTKNRVADAMYRLTGRSFYDSIGQDTVAMIVNDLITLGAMPISLAMHLAVGTSEWFADAAGVADLVRGWQHACNLSRAVWGGGETPTLRGIVEPDTAVLAGSAVGVIRPKERLIRPALAEGDVILFLAASGIHANGLTLAQQIAERLPQGYLTPIADGRPYGEDFSIPPRSTCRCWTISSRRASSPTTPRTSPGTAGAI